jgi:hypothetical protein
MAGCHRAGHAEIAQNPSGGCAGQRAIPSSCSKVNSFTRSEAIPPPLLHETRFHDRNLPFQGRNIRSFAMTHCCRVRTSRPARKLLAQMKDGLRPRRQAPAPALHDKAHVEAGSTGLSASQGRFASVQSPKKSYFAFFSCIPTACRVELTQLYLAMND